MYTSDVPAGLQSLTAPLMPGNPPEFSISRGGNVVLSLVSEWSVLGNITVQDFSFKSRSIVANVTMTTGTTSGSTAMGTSTSGSTTNGATSGSTTAMGTTTDSTETTMGSTTAEGVSGVTKSCQVLLSFVILVVVSLLL